MMQKILSLLFPFIISVGSAQENFTPECLQAEHQIIKHLTGKWIVTSKKLIDLTDGEWVKSTAIALWKLELDGCVWTEHWEGTIDGRPLEWVQHIAYDHRNKKWQQSMVDSAHGNIISSEGFYSDKMLTFTSPQMRNGQLLIDKTIIQFISSNRIEWKTQSSFDGGQTWTTFWIMLYLRSK